MKTSVHRLSANSSVHVDVPVKFINEEKSAMGYTNILQWLQGRVAGLTIQMENGEYVPYIRNTRATLYIDEMIADPNWVGMLPVSNIAMIKIIKGPTVIAPHGGGGGIVATYTARGDLRPPTQIPSLPNNTIKGYDAVKKFFSSLQTLVFFFIISYFNVTLNSIRFASSLTLSVINC